MGGIDGVKAEEAAHEVVKCDGLVTLSSPDYGTFKTELQVASGLEADLLDVDPGVAGIDHIGLIGGGCSGFIVEVWHIGMPPERPYHNIVAEISDEPGEERDVDRLDTVDTERIDVFRVVGVGHSATQSRPQPVVLFSEGDFMVEKVRGNVGFHDPRIGGVGDGSHWDGGLGIRGVRTAEVRGVPSGAAHTEGRAIYRTQRVGKRLRVASGRGRFLELAARIKSKPASSSIAAGASVVIEAALIGTAIVVDDSGTEMKAIAQGCAADTADHGVSRLYVRDALVCQALHSGVVVQIMAQCSADILRLASGRNPKVIRVHDL